jgi:polyhydroxybutyrate depolymerase
MEEEREARRAGETTRDRVLSIKVAALTREFVLHLPPAHQRGDAKLPLVLFFHGGKSRAEQMDKLTGFNGLADEKAFIVAYPKGIDQRWNDGRGSPFAAADDIGFVRELVDHLVKTYRVDPRRVYATGISNGGIFLHLLACRLAGRIAAIAPVAGTVPTNVAQTCGPAAAVPVLMAHGTNDPLVLWEGGTGEKRGQIGGSTLSVIDSIAFWASRNGCERKPPVTTNISSTKDGTATFRMEYCPDVVLYKVVEGGHTWPGGWQYAPERIIGKTSRDFSATRTIWQFFQDRARKQSN